nr:MAG TPA: hypothetical protein [Caudoviricetes sp.]
MFSSVYAYVDRSQFAKVLKLFINLRLITIFNSNP